MTTELDTYNKILYGDDYHPSLKHFLFSLLDKLDAHEISEVSVYRGGEYARISCNCDRPTWNPRVRVTEEEIVTPLHATGNHGHYVYYEFDIDECYLYGVNEDLLLSLSRTGPWHK